MAETITFTGSATSNSGHVWKLTLVCSYTQDTAKNLTNITATLKTTIPTGVGNPYNLYQNDAYYVIGSSGKKYKTFEYEGGKTYTLGEYNFTVAHNDEGEGTLSVNFQWYTGLGTKWSPELITGSGSKKLPTIPRKTSISTNLTNLTLSKKDLPITIKLSPKSTKFYHKLLLNGVVIYPESQQSDAAKKYGIAIKQSGKNDYVFKFNEEALKTLYNDSSYLKSKSKSSIKFSCYTYSDSKYKTHIGTTTANVSISASKDYCGIKFPNTLSITDKSNESTKYFYYDKSQANLSVTLTKNTAGIDFDFNTSKTTINGKTASINGLSVYVNNVTIPSSRSIKINVQDKRGFTYSKTYTIKTSDKIGGKTLTTYVKPRLTLKEVERIEENGKYGLEVICNYYDSNNILSDINPTITATKNSKSFNFSSTNAKNSSANTWVIKVWDNDLADEAEEDGKSASEQFDNASYEITITWNSDYQITASSKEIALILFSGSAITAHVPFNTLSSKYMQSLPGTDVIRYGLSLKNSDLIGVNALFFNDDCSSGNGGGREGIFFPRQYSQSGTNQANFWKTITWKEKSNYATAGYEGLEMKFEDCLRIHNGTMYINNVQVWPVNNYSSFEDRIKNTTGPTSIDMLLDDYVQSKKTGKVQTYFSDSSTYLYGLPRTVPSIEYLVKALGLNEIKKEG